MTQDQIKLVLENAIADSQAQVTLDGSHVHLNVVSPAFAGLNAVKRQQLVYSALNDAIASGAIHAVHMKTYTPEEKTQQA